MLNKTNKSYIFFGFVFILGLLPHMQFFPLDVTVSGRWFYISAIGLLGLLGLIIKDKYFNFLIIIIIIFASLTFDRSFDFRNGFSLYYNDIKLDPDNFNLNNNLGVEYFRLGNIAKAGYYFQKSVEENPYWWTNYNNLGVYYENTGDISKAKEMYQRSIKNGNYYLAYENYARVLIKEKKHEEAKEFITESLKYFPENITLQEFLQQLSR